MGFIAFRSPSGHAEGLGDNGDVDLLVQYADIGIDFHLMFDGWDEDGNALWETTSTSDIEGFKAAMRKIFPDAEFDEQ